MEAVLRKRKAKVSDGGATLPHVVPLELTSCFARAIAPQKEPAAAAAAAAAAATTAEDSAFPKRPRSRRSTSEAPTQVAPEEGHSEQFAADASLWLLTLLRQQGSSILPFLTVAEHASLSCSRELGALLRCSWFALDTIPELRLRLPHHRAPLSSAEDAAAVNEANMHVVVRALRCCPNVCRVVASSRLREEPCGLACSAAVGARPAVVGDGDEGAAGLAAAVRGAVPLTVRVVKLDALAADTAHSASLMGRGEAGEDGEPELQRQRRSWLACDFSPRTLRTITSVCLRLRELHIEASSLTDAAVGDVCEASGCASLQELQLWNGKELTNDILTSIGAAPFRGLLKRLTVTESRVTAAGISSLAGSCPNLQAVDLSGNAGVTAEALDVVMWQLGWVLGFVRLRGCLGLARSSATYTGAGSVHGSHAGDSCANASERAPSSCVGLGFAAGESAVALPSSMDASAAASARSEPSTSCSSGAGDANAGGNEGNAHVSTADSCPNGVSSTMSSSTSTGTAAPAPTHTSSAAAAGNAPMALPVVVQASPVAGGANPGADVGTPLSRGAAAPADALAPAASLVSVSAASAGALSNPTPAAASEAPAASVLDVRTQPAAATAVVAQVPASDANATGAGGSGASASASSGSHGTDKSSATVPPAGGSGSDATVADTNTLLPSTEAAVAGGGVQKESVPELASPSTEGSAQGGGGVLLANHGAVQHTPPAGTEAQVAAAPGEALGAESDSVERLAGSAGAVMWAMGGQSAGTTAPAARDAVAVGGAEAVCEASSSGAGAVPIGAAGACPGMLRPCWSAGLVTVRVLDLTGCSGIDTVGLQQLLRSLPQPCNLEELHLSAIPSVRPETVDVIVATCPRLRRAFLQELPHLTDRALFRLLQDCTDLRAVLLDGCAGITDDFVSHVAEHCVTTAGLSEDPVAVDLTELPSPASMWPQHLATISLLRCSRVTEAALSALVSAVLPSAGALKQFLVAHEDEHDGQQPACRTMHVGKSRLDRLRVLQLRAQTKLQLISNA